MKQTAAVILIAIASLVAASPASAAYNGHATKAAFSWAKRHHPRWAISASVKCYQTGYHTSRCSITYRGGGSQCQNLVKVSGYNYHVWRYDSTC